VARVEAMRQTVPCLTAVERRKAGGRASGEGSEWLAEGDKEECDERDLSEPESSPGREGGRVRDEMTGFGSQRRDEEESRDYKKERMALAIG